MEKQFQFFFQKQHEKRTNDRENYLNLGRDHVQLWEIKWQADTDKLQTKMGKVWLSYGMDGTNQRVESKAWTTLVRSQITRANDRGQYLNGSTYQTLDGWSDLRWKTSSLFLRLGGRLNWTQAFAPEEINSYSKEVDRSWLGEAFGGGIEWSFLPAWTALFNIEQGFAPPNLDDLTARQLTGQGFQIENPNLSPERATTYELGLRTQLSNLHLETWGFATQLKDGIERRDTECPPSERSCRASRITTPFTLINLQDSAWILGVEHRLQWKVSPNWTLLEHVSYAWGEGPSPLRQEEGETRPLSRIPPLNGRVALRWENAFKAFYMEGSFRWALNQDRLSFGDTIDHRIPYLGTPGYGVYDLRLGLKLEGVDLNLVFENLTDQVYRVHGSSINGAGRGVLLSVRYTPQSLTF